MNQAAIRELESLLPKSFETSDHLRRWIRRLSDGDRIVNSLPGGNVGQAQLIFAIVDIFERWGLLGTAEFWDSLYEVAPANVKQGVVALRAKFGVPPHPDHIPTPAPISPSPPAPSAAAPPTTIIVLFVSANPQTENRLRVDREFRDIENKLKSGRYRDQLKLVQVHAAGLADLRAALHEHAPHVLHIGCHGEADGTLLLEAPDGGTQRVTKRQVIGLLAELNDNLKLVVLNACDSHVLAGALTDNVDAAIGMVAPIEDQAAIDFSVALYESIGYGRTVEKSFKIALASLEMGDEQVPRLFPTTDQDSGKKRQLVLVKKP